MLDFTLDNYFRMLTYHVQSKVWEEAPFTSGGPPPLSGHTATLYQPEDESLPAQMIIVGGVMVMSSGGNLVSTWSNAVWIMNVDSLEWSLAEATGNAMFNARQGHSTTLYNNKLYIFGGFSQDGYMSTDVMVLDLDTRYNRSHCPFSNSLLQPLISSDILL